MLLMPGATSLPLPPAPWGHSAPPSEGLPVANGQLLPARGPLFSEASSAHRPKEDGGHPHQDTQGPELCGVGASDRGMGTPALGQ